MLRFTLINCWRLSHVCQAQYATLDIGLTDFNMHVEIILDLANFSTTAANNHADFLRVNVHFAGCAVWIKVVVGSWCTTVVEVHSWLALTTTVEMLPSGTTVLPKTALWVSTSVTISIGIAWTLSCSVLEAHARTHTHNIHIHAHETKKRKKKMKQNQITIYNFFFL